MADFVTSSRSSRLDSFRPGDAPAQSREDLMAIPAVAVRSLLPQWWRTFGQPQVVLQSGRRVLANIPFVFSVGNTRLKAGSYTVEQLQSAIIAFSSEDRTEFWRGTRFTKEFILAHALSPYQGHSFSWRIPALRGPGLA
jgi:hypothetical protein